MSQYHSLLFLVFVAYSRHTKYLQSICAILPYRWFLLNSLRLPVNQDASFLLPPQSLVASDGSMYLLRLLLHMYKELRYTWYISNTNNMIYRILNRLNKQRLPISIKSLFLDVRISSVSSAGLRCFVQLEWLAGSVHHDSTMTFTFTT